MKHFYFKTKQLIVALLFVLATPQAWAQVISLGAGTTAPSGTTAGPINEFYRSLHCQMVYTAAELNATGVFGGAIIKLGFYVEAGVTNVLPNYTVKMKHTSAPDVSIYDGTGLTTHYNVATYNPTAGGFDMLTLNTPFIWNGIDNILVDVCFDQVSAYTSTGRVRVYTPTVPSGFIYVRSDSSPQCGVNCSAISVNKPQIQFEFIPPSPIDFGVATFLKPLGTKKCFGNDTIVARITNYGTNDLDLSSNPVTIKVQSTGANNSAYTAVANTGTIASNTSKDYTVTTAYNMSGLGNYYLKAYSTVLGDGSALNDTVFKTITKTPFFSHTISPNDTVCQTIPVHLSANYSHLKQVGSGIITNSAFSNPAPFGNNYEGSKHHFLILASELATAGLNAGNFTSISLNATNLNGTDPLTGFNIAMATTTVSNLTGFSEETFVNYVSTPSYTPVLGMNTMALSSPFAWDGVSNLVIETCFNNDLGFASFDATSNVSVMQTSTSFTSSVWFNDDDNFAVCTNTAISSSLKRRPNFYFEQINPVTYTWSPAIGLSATNIFNPIAILTSSQTYSVGVTTNGCMSYDTLRITTKLADIPHLGNDTNLCSVPYTLNANVVASAGYLWNTGSVNAGIPINNSGKYWVQTTSASGCVVADTIQINVSSYPIVTLGADTAFCAGSTINLYCGNAGSTILWNTGANTPFITVGTVGTYSVMVTNAAGCKESDIINVGTKAKPTVSLAFTGQTHFCPTSNNPRPLTEGVPTGGTYIGSGVSGNNFIPAQASQGSYVIIYNYTGPNGCSNSATSMLYVDACVGIEELAETFNLNVYPNPNNGEFTLEIQSASELSGKLHITTVDGRLVYEDVVSGTGLTTKNIDITNLANGIYYLQIQSKDAVKTYKLLKQ